MDFTTTGEKLASVGQAPDFMLTVWDWVNEKVILHCKAFGQDVAKVSEMQGNVDTKKALLPVMYASGSLFARDDAHADGNYFENPAH